MIGRKPVSDAEKAENKRLTIALIRWLRDRARLRLRAIVDSGNKSTQAWFDRPPEAVVRDLATIAAAFRFDSSGLNGAQPFRIPGAPFLHEETRVQPKLLYLDAS